MIRHYPGDVPMVTLIDAILDMHCTRCGAARCDCCTRDCRLVSALEETGVAYATDAHLVIVADRYPTVVAALTTPLGRAA